VSTLVVGDDVGIRNLLPRPYYIGRVYRTDYIDADAVWVETQAYRYTTPRQARLLQRLCWTFLGWVAL
jgi:hypothetical protein